VQPADHGLINAYPYFAPPLIDYVRKVCYYARYAFFAQQKSVFALLPFSAARLLANLDAGTHQAVFHQAMDHHPHVKHLSRHRCFNPPISAYRKCLSRLKLFICGDGLSISSLNKCCSCGVTPKDLGGGFIRI
jgi:hypothetical protein